MKAPRLHLTISPRPRRATHARARATTGAWRAPPLIWRRLLPGSTPIAVTRSEQHLHRQFFAALHFHLLHTDGPGAARAATAVTAHEARAMARATPRPHDAPRLITLRRAQTVWTHRSVHPLRAPAVHRDGTLRSVIDTAAVARGSVPALSRPAPSTNEAPARQAARRLAQRVHAAAPIGPARIAAATAVRRAHDIHAEVAGDGVRAFALRSPALVWAKPEPASAAPPTHADAPATSAAAHAAPPPSRTASAAAAALPPAQFQQLARDTQRSLLLDASFTDRLADGVLSRVDKRLRIERERRGL